MIKAVIFDMDGTLIDTEKYYRIFWPKALAHFGYEMSDEQALSMSSLGCPYAPKHLKEMFHDPNLDYDAIRAYRKKIMEEALQKNGIELKKGAIELLEFLKTKKIKRAIATATDEERATRYLKQIGLYPYFDKIIDSEGSSIQTELNNKLDKSAVVNTLTSSSTTNPLSAEQGRVLNVTTVKMTGNQQISGYKYFSQGLFATYPINRNNNPFDDSTDPTIISPTSVINYQYLDYYSNSKKFKPSQIMPQNDSTSGIVPLTYGAETHSVRNVSSFLPANAISIEYTTDGGTTWTDYGASDEVKRKIFAEDTTNYIKIGGKNITTDTITDQCMTRVTIDPVVDGRYSNAFMFYCWVTTSGVKDMKCKIECSTIGAPDTFTTVRDEVTVSGWSGPNTITFSTKSFGGGANQTSNQCKYRFTFRSLQPNNKIASFTDLRLYGYSVWTPKNNYMKAGTIYSTSYDQNVIFPAQLSANTLEIETNGSVGTNLTNAIQSITNDIPVATTVPATLAVNTIYDVGQQTTLNLTLPSGKVGNYIQVDFLSPSTPTTLGINSEAGISDFSLVPSANTIYSLYFEWGTLYYNSTTSKCVYGWRFKYDEYTHTV